MSKVKEILTDDIYVKVEPRGNMFAHGESLINILENQCEDIEKQINRHVDDIGSTGIVRTYKYIYEDEHTEYEEDSVIELCKEIAYQRDLISKNEDSLFRYFHLDNNNERCSSYYCYFEDLLEGVVNRNVVEIQGKLSDYQRALVNIAIELNDRELNIEFKED